jgi:hypothetical protein
MTKRIISACGASYFSGALLEMKARHGWDLVYSVESQDSVGVIRRAFPNAIIHDVHSAICGVPPEGVAIDEIATPLDQNTVHKFLHCESICLKMMDRLGSSVDFGYAERIQHYYDLLSYWLGVVNKYRPDLVVFETTPHMVYDYILYCICDVVGVDVLVLEKTPIPNIIYGMRDFERGFEELKSEIKKSPRSGCGLDLWPETTNYISGVRKDYHSARPPHLIDTQNYSSAKISKRIFIELKVLLGAVFFGAPRTYELYRGLRPSEFDKKNRFKYLLQRYRCAFARLRIKYNYQKLCTSFDKNKPYVFFALQCQPEKSTSPLGDVYAHQYLAIKLLASVLPYGWCLYVKEHVSQFYFVKSAERSKSADFYRKISEIPNVKFVSLAYSSFDLIDSSRGVAVTTGTVGIESILRGKPVIMFGETWYSGIDGAYTAKSKNELVEAIRAIVDGVSVDEIKVAQFFSVLQSQSIRGFNHFSYQKRSSVSIEEMAVSLAGYLERKYA